MSATLLLSGQCSDARLAQSLQPKLLCKLNNVREARLALRAAQRKAVCHLALNTDKQSLWPCGSVAGRVQ